jgi:hypothetical protein
MLQERPLLAGEPAFRDLAREHGATLPYDDGAVTRLLGEFAETLLPGTVLSSPREIEDLLQVEREGPRLRDRPRDLRDAISVGHEHRGRRFVHPIWGYSPPP